MLWDSSLDKCMVKPDGQVKKNLESPFKLERVFGHDTRVPPVNLSTQSTKKLFFTAGSVGVIYNWIHNTQNILQGHTGDIIFTTVTENKTYLATADSGLHASVIIWNSLKREKLFEIIGYFPEKGVKWMTFSSDGNILMILSAEVVQELTLWNWKSQKCSPVISYKFTDTQHHLIFHPKDSNHFVSTSVRNVCFFKKDKTGLSTSSVNLKQLYNKKMCQKAGNFTQTTFSSITSLAYTATERGMIILWNCPLNRKKLEQLLYIDPDQRVCLRMIQLLTCRCAITFLSIINDCLIVGTETSHVSCFDQYFKLLWSVDAKTGAINNVSFNLKPRFTLKQIALRVLGKSEEKKTSHENQNDFIVSTSTGLVAYVIGSTLQMQTLLSGTPHHIKAITIHPFLNISRKALSEDLCASIECLSIDNNGSYIACAFSNGNIAVFDAVSLSATPCYIYKELRYKASVIKFSPDPQYFVVVDEGLYVTRFQLFLSIPSALLQIKKESTSLEEPLWCFRGKRRQHRSHITDTLFNKPKEKENILFHTLGDDRIVVQYNISSARSNDIEVTKLINLEKVSKPLCMCWYPLYNLEELLGVISNDDKLQVYSVEDDKMVQLVSLPSFGESYEKIELLEHFDDKEKKSLKHLVFHSAHLIGLSKFPMDGNPNTSLAIPSHVKGISKIASNYDQTFLFTVGMNDSWVYMYKMSTDSIKMAEKLGGEGLTAITSLFPKNEDPEDFKQRLMLGIYSLESEVKMLNLSTEIEPILKGEIPVDCLEYIMAVLGFFPSVTDLELLLNDIEFENIHLYEGRRTTLNCMDIIRCDQMPREEFLKILKTLKGIKNSDSFPTTSLATYNLKKSSSDHYRKSFFAKCLMLGKTQRKSV